MRTVSLSEVAGGVRWLTLNRPDDLNALTAQLVADFGGALDQVQPRQQLPGNDPHRGGPGLLRRH